MCVSCSRMSNSETPWTVALQVPLSMEFSRQENWSGLLFPSPGVLPDPGISCTGGRLFTDEPPGKPFQLYSGSQLSRLKESQAVGPHWGFRIQEWGWDELGT